MLSVLPSTAAMPPLRLIPWFLLGVLSVTAGETPNTHFDFRREAVTAYQRQDFPAMAAACETALHLRPDSPRYLFNLALAQTLLQQPDKAIGTLHRLAALGVTMPVETTPDFAPLQTHSDYANGLLTIDLLDRAVRTLSPPADVTLLGIDGLLARNRTIVAVQNGINPQRLVRFTLSPDSRTITDFIVLAANLPGMDDLTLPTFIDGQPAFISNSGWSKFAGAKEPPPPHTGRIMQLPPP